MRGRRTGSAAARSPVARAGSRGIPSSVRSGCLPWRAAP